MKQERVYLIFDDGGQPKCTEGIFDFIVVVGLEIG